MHYSLGALPILKPVEVAHRVLIDRSDDERTIDEHLVERAIATIAQWVRDDPRLGEHSIGRVQPGYWRDPTVQRKLCINCVDERCSKKFVGFVHVAQDDGKVIDLLVWVHLAWIGVGHVGFSWEADPSNADALRATNANGAAAQAVDSIAEMVNRFSELLLSVR